MNPIHTIAVQESPVAHKKRKLDFSHIPQIKEKGASDYPLAVTTSELKLEKTLLKIRRAPIIGDTVIGVSGFFALDVATQRGDLFLHNTNAIKNVVIIDCSLKVWGFWKQVGKIVRRCKLRETVIDRIKTIIKEQSLFTYADMKEGPCASIVGADYQIKKLQYRIDKGLSWLSTEEYFQKAKKMFDDKRIFTLLSDIKELKEVIKEVVDGGHTVDTVYLSDLFPPCTELGGSHIFKNTIPPGSLLIQSLAYPLFCCGKHLALKVFTDSPSL